MGLDAFVRCNCFEEHKLKPGPVPYEDLYIDADGYLSSRKLDSMWQKYDFAGFDARYGELQDQFMDWRESCCEHEDCKYCNEWVSNWAGVMRFNYLVETFGGKEKYPLLFTLLPSANGGYYPLEKAEATLLELDDFLSHVVKHAETRLFRAETNEMIQYIDKEKSPWSEMIISSIDIADGKVKFTDFAKKDTYSNHFKIIFSTEKVISQKYGEIGIYGCEIHLLDQGKTIVLSNYYGSRPSIMESEYLFKTGPARFLYEGKYPTGERIKNLLVASLETGNPIVWC